MVKKRAYVETSVISYLAAWLSKDALMRIRQQQTALWWERRHEWDCIVSDTVIVEIARGDPVAAARRLGIAQSLVEVLTLPEAELLAGLLVARKLVPESAKPDAVHLATAAAYGAHYLLTWNQKHLDNLDLRYRIEDVIRNYGWTPAKVITPSRLLEES